MFHTYNNFLHFPIHHPVSNIEWKEGAEVELLKVATTTRSHNGQINRTKA